MGFGSHDNNFLFSFSFLISNPTIVINRKWNEVSFLNPYSHVQHTPKENKSEIILIQPMLQTVRENLSKFNVKEGISWSETEHETTKTEVLFPLDLEFPFLPPIGMRKGCEELLYSTSIIHLECHFGIFLFLFFSLFGCYTPSGGGKVLDSLAYVYSCPKNMPMDQSIFFW